MQEFVTTPLCSGHHFTGAVSHNSYVDHNCDVEVALDVEILRSPLHSQSRPAALHVLVPSHEPHTHPRIFGRPRTH